MQRKYTIILVLLLVSLLFTGCGKKKAKTETLNEISSMLQEELENLEQEDFPGEDQSSPEEQDNEELQQSAKQESSSGAAVAEPDQALLKAVRELVDKAVKTENYYFETWGSKVWHQGQQRKVELWDLADTNTLDVTGERVYSGVVLSDHAAQRFKHFLWDRKNSKWIIQEIPAMQTNIDLMNNYHDILGVRLSQLKEMLDGWKGVDSEVERSYPHKNKTITYLELKSIQISEGTVTHQRDNKTWQVYSVTVESFERNKKGSDTITDMAETFYIDKNSGFPVTYDISASFNMHVTETYEYFNVQTGVQTDINFESEPVPGGTPVGQSNDTQPSAASAAGVSALSGGIPDDLNAGNLNEFIRSLEATPQYYLKTAVWVLMGDQDDSYEAQYWADGAFTREELTYARSGEKTVVLMDDAFIYVYNPATLEGHRTPIDITDTDDMDEEWNVEYSAVRKDTLFSMPVIYVEYLDEYDVEKTLIKSWITVQDGFPVFLQTLRYTRDELVYSSVMLEYKPGKPDAAVFEAPGELVIPVYDNSDI
ncbi:MAG: hypothetical protein KBA53_11990 [Thermoclostridium sp.]|nr:hypothetical protein [Thermoclostridium sp.]